MLDERRKGGGGGGGGEGKKQKSKKEIRREGMLVYPKISLRHDFVLGQDF